MITVDEAIVTGWKHAIYGARNPLNSWNSSDSGYDERKKRFVVGAKDMDLLKRLAKAGSDEAKYRRMLIVHTNITAPLYWWKQMDQYKVGTTTNSTSTMHRIHSKPIELSDFSYEDLELENGITIGDCMKATVDMCEALRKKYMDTNEKKYWRALIQLLPEGYNQKRTWCGNYETLANIYRSRKNHKLTEWRDLCEWIKTLPCSELIALEE